MSGENVSDAMMNLFCITISEGEFDYILKLLTEAFGHKYADLLQTIRDATYRHMDSTSWRNDGKNKHLCTFFTKGEAIFRISKSNGHDVPLRCWVNTRGQMYMTGTVHSRPWRKRQATISSTAGPI